MFDKYRSLTQSSAFKRQRKPSTYSPNLFRPTLPPNRSLSTRVGSPNSHGRAVLSGSDREVL